MTTPSASMLPPVAKSFYTMCKKCGAERYHRVLAHSSSTTAKIECEICHSKKTYSLPKAGGMAKKATTKTKTTKARKSTHADDFQAIQLNRSAEKGTPFSIKTKFSTDQKIDHPTFGPGFVKAVHQDRIDVIFESEVKTLMHNRP